LNCDSWDFEDRPPPDAIEWAIAISAPGRHLRIHDGDPDSNSFPETVPLGCEPGDEPDRAFAVHVTDLAGKRFFTMPVDCDASTCGATVAQRDAMEISAWLASAGIRSVVAESGPSGGRHVLATFPAGIPADEARHLSEVLTTRWRSVDPMPLISGSGSTIRPIGALHRRGSRSRTIAVGVPGWGVLPVICPDDEWAALERLRRGNDPAAMTELLADHPRRLMVPIVAEPTPPPSTEPLDRDLLLDGLVDRVTLKAHRVLAEPGEDLGRPFALGGARHGHHGAPQCRLPVGRGGVHLGTARQAVGREQTPPGRLARVPLA
jgi:hypothetical protein